MNPHRVVYTTTVLHAAVNKHMTSAERAWTLSYFEHWETECRRIAADDANSPESIAFTLHQALDKEVQALLAQSPRAGQVQCRRGCGSCCKVSVDVYPQEAVLLRSYAESQGIAIDEARLDRQAGKTADTWHELSDEDRACVFLGANQECQVYEHRPGTCRKYLVVTPREQCDMRANPGGNVGILPSIPAEIINSAAVTAYGAGNMARQLVRTRPGAPTMPADPRSAVLARSGAPAGGS